jgi:hypothetical protein
VHADICQIQAD